MKGEYSACLFECLFLCFDSSLACLLVRMICLIACLGESWHNKRKIGSVCRAGERNGTFAPPIGVSATLLPFAFPFIYSSSLLSTEGKPDTGIGFLQDTGFANHGIRAQGNGATQINARFFIISRSLSRIRIFQQVGRAQIRAGTGIEWMQGIHGSS